MIELRVLGELDLRDTADGRSLASVLARPKRIALLVRLALDAPSGIARDRMMAMFWPESTEERARNSLNQAVFHLRRAVGSEALSSTGDLLRLDRALVRCDASEMEAALDSGDLRRGVDLYGGEMLPGFHLSGCADFEHWLDARRERLRRRAVEAAVALGVGDREAGNAVGAARWLARASAWAPHRESVIAELLGTLADAGDRSGVVREYERFRQRLERDLGIAPSARLVELVEAVKRSGVGPTERSTTVASDTAMASSPAVPVEEQRPSPAPEANGADGPARTPGPASTPAPARSRMWPGIPAVLAGALVVGALVVGALATGIGDAPPVAPAAKAEVPQVAVLPFTVSGAPHLDYLSEGVVDLLSAKLAVPGQLRTVEPRVVLAEVARSSQPRSADVGPDIAERLGASHYITGNVLEAGGRLEIVARLHLASGASVATAGTLLPSEADLFTALDEIALQLVGEYSAEEGGRFSRTAALSTASLDALKAYLDGEQRLRTGDYSGSVASFTTAAAHDSLFALAHYRLAVAADWAGRNDVRVASLEEAWSGRDRLPERERLLLTARKHTWEAERHLRTLVTRYPDDVEAWAELADLLFHNPSSGATADEIRRAFGRALRYEPDNINAIQHLARLAAFERDHERLDSLVERAFALGVDGLGALELRALRAFAMADRNDQEDVLDEMRLLDDGTLEWMVFRTVAYSGALEDGHRLADLMTEPDRPAEIRALGHGLEAQLEAARGRAVVARAHAAEAGALHADVGLLTRAVLATAPLLADDERELLAVRDSLRARPRVPPPLGVGIRGASLLTPDLLDLLTGLVEVRLGETTAARAMVDSLRMGGGTRARMAEVLHLAIVLAGDAPPLAVHRPPPRGWVEPMAAELFQIGDLHRRLGNPRTAVRWFGVMTGEIPFAMVQRAPSHLRRAELHDALGERADAIRHYRRFAEMWSEADPALRPSVERAEARIRELGG